VTSLQSPGRQNSPEPFADLVAKIQAMQRELGDLTSSLLRSAGISVSPEGMTINRALEVLGQMNVQGDLDVSGGAVFSGDMRIEGTLSLPAGIIDNEALASPLRYVSAFGNSEGFAVPSSGETSQAIFTVQVPPGFTKASFIAEGAAGIHNMTGVPNYAYLRVRASYPGGASNFGTRNNVDIQVGHTRTLSALLVRQVPVSLTGGDLLTFYVTMFADTAVPATLGNFASTAALVTFTR